MKAVILVGGKATRMLPLTYNAPKAMLPVLNTPFLEHVIHHLSSHRVKDIILAQGHLAQSIEGYLGDGSRLGVSLRYVVEDNPLGTAGAIKNTESYIDESCLVLNGDIFTDLDISAMIKYHQERGAKATIALTPVDDPTSYGLIETDSDGRVARFVEKPDRSEISTNMINAGTYILEPEVLAQIPAQTNVSIERETFPQLLAQGKPVYAYSAPTYWIDIGTPEKYLELHSNLLRGEVSRYTLAPDNEVLFGKQSHVHPTSRITAPVVVGDNCSIGSNVELKGPMVIGHGSSILEDSVIESSIIWQNVQIGARVHLRKSIVADNCRIDSDSIVAGSILGDDVTVVSGCKVSPGSKIEPGTTVT
ncbi:sugar phosphate nucleotidyltransferase [Chloroflexota bacterium]